MTSWPSPVVRAIVLLATAAFITFTPAHSPEFGFLVFGVFGIVTAVVLAAFVLRTPGIRRNVVLGQALGFAIAGISSLLLTSDDVAALIVLVSSTAAVTGFLELYLGLRLRRLAPTDPTARDHIFLGALTAVLAIVTLMVPPDFYQSFTDPDGGIHAVTASVVVIGVFGGYAVIAGVYLAIAGVSLKGGVASADSAGASPSASASASASADAGAGAADADLPATSVAAPSATSTRGEAR